MMNDQKFSFWPWFKKQLTFFNIAIALAFFGGLVLYQVLPKIAEGLKLEKLENSKKVENSEKSDNLNNVDNTKINVWQILQKNYGKELLPIESISSTSATSATSPILSILQNQENQQPQQTKYTKPWLIINFWGTWCPPCVRELPLLQKFSQQHLAKNIQVMGIAFEDAAVIQKFLLEQKATQNLAISYPLFRQIDFSLMQTLSNGGQTYFPYTLLINSDGQIIERHIGELNADILNKWAAIKK